LVDFRLLVVELVLGVGGLEEGVELAFDGADAFMGGIGEGAFEVFDEDVVFGHFLDVDAGRLADLTVRLERGVAPPDEEGKEDGGGGGGGVGPPGVFEADDLLDDGRSALGTRRWATRGSTGQGDCSSASVRPSSAARQAALNSSTRARRAASPASIDSTLRRSSGESSPAA
jgi:hypothetical protein